MLKTEYRNITDGLEECRKNLARYENLFSNIYQGILVEDPERNIIYANKAFYDIFGIPSEASLVGVDCSEAAKTSSELFTDPEEFIERTDKILSDGKTVKGDELHLKDKRILTRDFIVAEMDDDFIGNIWVYRDVTEDHQSKRVLDESLQQLQAIFDNAITGIGYTDPTGIILDVNEAFVKLTGYSKKELTGKNFSDFTHPDDREIEIQIIKDLISKKKKHTQLEKRYITKKGKTIWVDLGISVIYDDRQRVVNLIGVAKDETHNKEADQREKRRLELENLRAEIWKTASLLNDEDALIYSLLEKAGPVLGVENLSFMPYDKEEKEIIVKLIWRADGKDSGIGDKIPKWIFRYCLGKPHIYFSFDRIPDILKPVLKPFQKKYHTKSTLVIPYGDPEDPKGFLSSQTYNFNKSYTRNEISVFREISDIIYLRTKQIQNEKTLRENEIRLRDLNDTKDRLFSVIGHDLKNPLNAINGFSELINSRYDKIDQETLLKYITLMHQSSKEASVLLDNLLEWARIQTGQMVYSPQKSRLGEIMKPLLNLLKLNLEKKNIRLETDFKEDQIVYADAKMLAIVLRNLLSNAIKFSHKGGKVVLKAEPVNGGIEISISDEGTGIDRKNISGLFKIGENFTLPGTENEKGTGLGLILCQEFINRHGSKIEVKSKKGKGSRFSFILHTENPGLGQKPSSN